MKIFRGSPKFSWSWPLDGEAEPRAKRAGVVCLIRYLFWHRSEKLAEERNLALMLRHPAPCGRGSENLMMGQQARGYGSVLISIGDCYVRRCTTGI
jgi:hypothetical protein